MPPLQNKLPISVHKNRGHVQVAAGDTVSLDCQHTAPVRGTDGILCVHLLQDEGKQGNFTGRRGWMARGSTTATGRAK